MTNAQPVGNSRNQVKNRLVTLSLLTILSGLALLEFSITATASKADSEASSEAGLEAPAYLRRRRHYRNQANQQVRQERNIEARERAQQQKRERQQLARGPQIKSYTHQGRGHGKTAMQNSQSGRKQGKAQTSSP